MLTCFGVFIIAFIDTDLLIRHISITGIIIIDNILCKRSFKKIGNVSDLIIGSILITSIIIVYNILDEGGLKQIKMYLTKLSDTCYNNLHCF